METVTFSNLNFFFFDLLIQSLGNRTKQDWVDWWNIEHNSNYFWSNSFKKKMYFIGMSFALVPAELQVIRFKRPNESENVEAWLSKVILCLFRLKGVVVLIISWSWELLFGHMVIETKLSSCSHNTNLDIMALSICYALTIPGCFFEKQC